MADGYISDDLESRLRTRAPVACRLCKQLLVRRSIVTDQIVIQCQQPKGEVSEVLSYLMLREANRGSCGMFDGF